MLKKRPLINKNQFPEDFYGLTVCLNRGFTPMVRGGEKFTRAIKNGNIKLIEANNNKDCLSRMVRNMADFYLNDQLINISDFPMIKKGMDMKENKVIKEMNENGQIFEIMQKYK